MGETENGEEQAGGCGPCARAGGLLLLGLAGVLAWMGADLLSGGALTRIIAGGIVTGAPLPGEAPGSDNGGQEATDSDDSA